VESAAGAAGLAATATSLAGGSAGTGTLAAYAEAARSSSKGPAVCFETRMMGAGRSE
jgi:hypothetical protein